MLGFAMSPRRNQSQRKTTSINSKAELRIQKGAMNESSTDSDEGNGSYEVPSPAGTSLKNLENGKEGMKLEGNEKCCQWWLALSKKVRQERENCIKIYVLSPFLFGVVPPGLEDKVIDWTYECNLLPNKDVQQVFTQTDQTFESVRTLEDAFCVLAEYWNSKEGIANILNLKDKFIKQSSAKAAIKCAESNQWFKKLRAHEKLMGNSNKEMGDMSFLLAIYHFAGHVQFSVDDDADILKRYQQDCQLGEEKALELKGKGNAEFSSENYRAAISLYSRAVGLSPFNYIVYGNRAQTFLKLGEYRRALLDAKRSVILKPDWDKGQYRFNQAVKALQESEEEKAPWSFFTGQKNQNASSQENTFCQEKKKTSEACKEKANSTVDNDCDDLPDLVSACDSDTSGENFDDNLIEDDNELPDDVIDDKDENEVEMPALLEDNTNESSPDEDDSGSSFPAKFNAVRREKMKMNKKVAAMIIGGQQARKEEEAKKEEKAKKMATEKQKDVERKKIPKSEKPKTVIPVSPADDLIPLSERKTQIEEILREGSKALVHNSFEQASERYSKALGIIDTGPRKSLGFSDKSYVVVLYAFGTAMLEMGLQNRVEAARCIFENIVDSFKSVEFPLAYYGLGRVYYQQNRFLDAVSPLEECLKIVGDRSFDAIYWPGSDIVIEETKKKNMKAALESILIRCKFPPKPDATCRFHNCNRSKKTIYNNDSDYKGYVRLLCNDACIVEYHIHCWKKLKSNGIEKSSEKDFLDSECLTPSCCGQISRIQIHDVDGLKEEFQSAKQKLKKDTKAEKTLPTTTTAISKKKKRPKKKETKPEVTQREYDPNEAEPKQDTQPTVAGETKVIPDKQEDENEVNHTDTNEVANFPDTGMFVLKKTDDEPILQTAKQTKGKNKKKKKNVQSLDEFLGRDSELYRPRPSYFNGEDYDEIPAEPFNRKPPPGWMAGTFTIPSHLQSEARLIENSLKTYSDDPWKRDSIREYVYSSFIQLLKVRGSLHVDSEPMKEHLEVLPEEAQKLVEEDGGLFTFLTQCSLFTIENGVVTNLEEKFMHDLSKEVYKDRLYEIDRGQRASSNDLGNTTIDQEQEKISGLLQSNSRNTAAITSVDGIVPVGDDSKVNSACSDSGAAGALSSVDGVVYVGNDSKENTACSHLNHEDSKEEPVRIGKDDIKNKPQTSEKTEEQTKHVNGMSDLEYSKEIVEVPQSSEPKEVIGLPRNWSPSLLVDQKRHDDIIAGAKKCVEEAMKCDFKDVESKFINAVTSVLSSEDLITQYQKTKEIKEMCNTSEGGAPSATEAASTAVEIKSTKEKGVQAKPTVKNKTAMTEPMIERYKIEYEKLLCESEAWNLKRQEVLDKTDKLQQKHCQQMISLNKKLQDLEKHNENNNKKLEDMECRYQQDIQTFHHQKHESEDKIKKLQEQLATKSEADEKRIEVLKTSLAAMEARHQEERELLQTELKNALKFKTISQQHAQRACNAEVKLLELQRDVSFSFYARALQEADVTLHNLSQMLAMNPSPQLHEISQKWQRYITECKHQMGLNKTQFETFIPQVKEGKPLATLTSLHIARPGAYPGPPILHLPRGVLPPVHKPPVPKPPVPLRPESSASTNNNLPGKHNLAAVTPAERADGPRPPVSQPVPVNQPNRSENSSAVAADVTSSKASDLSQKASNSFEKIMLRLSTLFPNYTRIEMTNFIKEVRASKNGSLTGLSFDDIVGCVTQLVSRKESQSSQSTAVGATKGRQQAVTATDVLNPIVSSLPKPAAPLTKPVAPIAKPVTSLSKPVVSLSKPVASLSKPVASLSKPVASLSKPVASLSKPVVPSFSPSESLTEASKSSHATAQGSSSSSQVIYEDDPCVICHDEMSNTTRNVSLDCGHKFHHECIKKWLVGEQSTCPTCRVHALLPEEFPQLK